jgi:hypothetical protein
MKIKKTKTGFNLKAESKEDSNDLLNLIKVLSGEDPEKIHEEKKIENNAPLVQLDRTSDF